MISFAVITKNKCQFNNLDKYAKQLVYRPVNENGQLYDNLDSTIECGNYRNIKKDIDDYIWSNIEEYINIVNVSCDDDVELYNNFIKELIKDYPERKTDEFIFESHISYSFPKKMFEIFIAIPNWEEYQKNKIENMNDICCLYNIEHKIMENTCVVVPHSYDINNKYFLKSSEITKYDLIRMIRRRFYFSAILIKPDFTIYKYYFQDPKPLLSLIFGNAETHRLNCDVFRYGLSFYYTKTDGDKINKCATRINGKFRLSGNVLIIHEPDNNIYANISRHEFKRLNLLCYSRLYDRTTIFEKIQEHASELSENIVLNKYLGIELRMNEFIKFKCMNCGIQTEKKQDNVCQQCYRAIYCSLECKQNFQDHHYDDCAKNI